MKTNQNFLPMAVACLALLCAMPLSLQANTFTVINNNDSGGGSLRAMLGAAVDGDTIDARGVSGTITLTTGQLSVPVSVTILGPGGATLTVNGNHASRVFSVTGTSVTISGLTIFNGYTITNGAGIYASPGGPGSSITLSNCVVANNSTTQTGGGIYNDLGRTLTVTNCIISSNSATIYGGGIYSLYAMSVVSGSTISGNRATSRGGGIYNNGDGGNATLILNACSLSNNWSGNLGGGIFNDGWAGTANLTNNACTFSGNTAVYDGGAIYNLGGGSGKATVALSGGTVCSNSATFAGGIYNDGTTSLGATVTITNCLLYANRATNAGGALFNGGADSGGNATMVLNSTIISNNWAVNDGGGVINDGDSSGHATLTVTNCTLFRNVAYYGGGIENNGELGNATNIIVASTISSNSANNGGGIYSDGQTSSTMTTRIYDSILSGNVATNDGGAIYSAGMNSGSATLTLSNCIISGNRATNWAGAIFNDATSGNATLTVSTCTVTNNWATEAGGILNYGVTSGHATLTLTASTISSNSAADTGGGIFNSGYGSGNGTLTVTACNLSGNTAANWGGGVINDGRVSGNAAALLTSSTLTGNLADLGGAIHNLGSLTVLNSRFTNNVAQGPAGQTPGSSSSGGGGGGAAGMGGAIFSDGAVLTLTNSVFSGNLAVGGKGGDGVGHGSSNVPGGNGGGVNGGLGGAVGHAGNAGGLGGGGGGGAGGTTGYVGGAGGLGGGGGGGGAQTGTGGVGGIGGTYGGNGGLAASSASGGGGGGAGLGGAVFANSGAITVLSCAFTGNLATNGVHGADSVNAQSGQGVGGALFSVVTNVLVQDSTFNNNVASSYAPDMAWPFLVFTLADSGPGSLRQMLASATNGATIDFGVSGTITLTSGPLTIATNVTLLGPGPGALAVSGNNITNVFNVTGTNVTISGLTIANGYSPASGGGINVASRAGSSLALVNCVLTNNNADVNGGGIYLNPGVTMLVSNCMLRGNTAAISQGGGICNYRGVLTVVNSTLSANSSHLGGAIYNDGGSSTVTNLIANSTFSGNAADSWGGAIYNDGSSSGIATLKINSSTFSGNSGTKGGAICNYGPSGSAALEIGDTILNFSAGGGSTIYNSSGTVKSDGYNLITDGGGNGFQTGTNDQANVVDMKLGPLQDNGGPTWTHALLAGSPAIDNGKCNAITNLACAIDQRCLRRSVNLGGYPNIPGGDGTDIGAYEVQVEPAAVSWPSFNTNGAGWVLNGDPVNGGPTITNNVFTLTDNAANENRSAWFSSRLYVGGFQASFTYQDIGGNGADGAAFVIQNDPSGPAALGLNGGGLGYVGITPSVAVLLNIYSGAPGGASGLMLGTDGIDAYNPDGTHSGRSYQSTAPVNLDLGHPIAVGLRYTGGILYASLTDTATSANFQTNIPVDIPAFVGTNAAWVGFTGSEGGTVSHQIVSNFSYRPLPALTIRQSQPASLVFAWPATVYGFTLQSNQSLNNPAGWTSVAGTITQTDDLNQVTIPSPTGTRFYRLVLPAGP